jgi:hypothetical protein
MNQVEKAEKFIREKNAKIAKIDTERKSVKELTLFFLKKRQNNWSYRSLGDIYTFLLNYWPRLRLQTVINALLELTEEGVTYSHICGGVHMRVYGLLNKDFGSTKTGWFASELIDEYRIDYVKNVVKKQIPIFYKERIEGAKIMSNGPYYGADKTNENLIFKLKKDE